MQPAYDVTRRGPAGEPLRIECRAHAGCGWSLASTGPKKDDDPIFKAQFEHHLREQAEPQVQAFGVLRRARR